MIDDIIRMDHHQSEVALRIIYTYIKSLEIEEINVLLYFVKGQGDLDTVIGTRQIRAVGRLVRLQVELTHFARKVLQASVNVHLIVVASARDGARIIRSLMIKHNQNDTNEHKE